MDYLQKTILQHNPQQQLQPDMNNSTTYFESWYVSLLGLSDYFLSTNPPDIKACVHCLQSIFQFKLDLQIEARTHLQLGTILFKYTHNVRLALNHLNRAWTISQTIPSCEDITFESTSIIAQLYVFQNKSIEAKELLSKAIDLSFNSPYWYCRLLLQLVQLQMNDRDTGSAMMLLAKGVNYASLAQSEYTQMLFSLSKAMVLLIDKRMPEVQQLLGQLSRCLDLHPSSASMSGNQQLSVPLNPQKESLKVFFLVLQVYYYLISGQVKTVKPALKQLQQTIQTINTLHMDEDKFNTSNSIEMFQWMSKEHMCILVYLLTVMHSMQGGQMEKAQKYSDKALVQIEKFQILGSYPLMSSFQVMFFEHTIMCQLITGNKSIAIQQIYQICNLCQQHPKLAKQHNFQIHTLLGLYAMSINSMDAAEAQFKSALMSEDVELISFIKLNLCLVYLRMNRHPEVTELLNSLDPEKNTSLFHSLRTSFFYVKGIQAFFQSSYQDAKRFLRETLKMASAEDLTRLTSCSLVLLGHVFLSLGNSQEALNMINPVMQLAAKIPDIHVQLWASTVLKDLYRILENPKGEAESYQLHDSFSQKMLQDQFQATQLPEHRLIHWIEGPCPLYLLNPGQINTPVDCWNPAQVAQT